MQEEWHSHGQIRQRRLTCDSKRVKQREVKKIDATGRAEMGETVRLRTVPPTFGRCAFAEERSGPILRAMQNCQNVNHVLNYAVSDEVRSAGNGDFAGSSHAANSGGVGHPRHLVDRFSDPLHGAGRRSRIIVGNVIEYVPKLICCRESPANVHALARILFFFPSSSRIQESTIALTSSSSIISPFREASRPSSTIATNRFCSLM